MPISYGYQECFCGKSRAVREVRKKKEKGFDAYLILNKQGVVVGYRYCTYRRNKDEYHAPFQMPQIPWPLY